MLPAFLRPIYLAPAAIGAALFAWLVPINDGLVGRIVVLTFVWLVLAYGLYAIRDLIALGGDLTKRKAVAAPAIAVAEQAATERAVAERAVAERAVAEPAVAEPAVAEPAVAEPAVAEPAVAEPAVAEPAVAEPAVAERAVAAAPGAVPTLDANGQAEVRRIVALFAETGVFAPGAPEPAHLFEAAADHGAPITQGVVLAALHEAGYYHDDFDPATCLANLAFHASHAEQFEETLRGQITDIVRLSRGALEVRDVQIDLSLRDGPGPHPDCTIRMLVNGAPVRVTYAPAAKYLSTHIHVALAVALQQAATGARLAWCWDDQGVWLTALRPGALERLNGGLGPDADEEWGWVDDAEPIAAGETLGSSRSPSP